MPTEVFDSRNLEAILLALLIEKTGDESKAQELVARSKELLTHQKVELPNFKLPEM